MLKVKVVLFAIAVFIVNVVQAVDTSKELSKWFDHVKDPAYDCKDVTPSEKVDTSSTPILSVVDCDSEGARYDYSYKV